MLTYSLSLKNVVTILPLQKIVSSQFAKNFWNAPFKSEELSNIPKDIERKWEVRLANHREKTIHASGAFIEENEYPPLLKILLKESIFSLYQAYRQMLLWKITYDPKDNRIDLLEEGDLYAPNYFTVDGEFNDFIWAKRFVIDSNHNINHRFYLACFYWFENETAALWTELKRSGSAPFRGNLNAILPRMDPLITLRIFQLENQLQALAQDWQYEGNFWEVGLKHSAKKGYEYPTYYFWQEIAESKKISITENDSFFEFMSGAIDYPDDKVSYFLYSQLSKERKENLLDWTLEHNKPEKWLTLLLSPYTQAIRSEIIEFVYQLPIKLYSYLLQSLAHRIKQLKLPFDMEMFQVLWSNLSPEEKHDTLEEGTLIIQRLVQAKSFYNLGYIIKGLSLEQKENCLFNGWYGAGNSLDILCKEGEFDLLQNYLSFFLFELDPFTQIETLQKDASSFLKRFIESHDFRTWCQEEISKTEEKEVNVRIDVLQTSLALLDELCEKVCQEVINMPQASISTSLSASFFKPDPKINEETEGTFSFSSSQKRKCEEEETKFAKLQKK